MINKYKFKNPCNFYFEKIGLISLNKLKEHLAQCNLCKEFLESHFDLYRRGINPTSIYDIPEGIITFDDFLKKIAFEESFFEANKLSLRDKLQTNVVKKELRILYHRQATAISFIALGFPPAFKVSLALIFKSLNKLENLLGKEEFKIYMNSSREEIEARWNKIKTILDEWLDMKLKKHDQNTL